MTSSRPILSVIGPHSGCGKTSFVTHLLRSISGLGCLKISPAADWPEMSPDGENAIGGDFFLEEPARLNRPGKDTAVYLASGAAQVERLRHWRNGLRPGLAAAWQRFPAAMPVVVESSSAVKLLSPVAVVLVVRPPIREMKPTTRAALSLVTDLLMNASDRDGLAAVEAQRLCQEFPTLRPAHTWSADLISEPPPRKMLTRLHTLLTPDSR